MDLDPVPQFWLPNSGIYTSMQIQIILKNNIKKWCSPSGTPYWQQSRGDRSSLSPPPDWTAPPGVAPAQQPGQTAQSCMKYE